MSRSDSRPSTAHSQNTRLRFARDSVVLATGSAFAGVLVFAFFAVAARSLGAGAAAPVSVLWSYWAIAAAVLTFAVQHWTIRTLTHDGHGGSVRRSLPMLGVAGAVLAVVAGALAYVFASPLFGEPGLTYPALVAAITVGSLFMGLVRGVLAGRRRYAATALSLAGENALRVAGATAVALAGGGAEAFGLALAAGPLLGLVWLPGLHLTPATSVEASAQPTPTPTPASPTQDPPAPAEPSEVPEKSPRNPLALASGIAGGSLIAQLVLTGAPVVLAAIGGAPAAVTSLFVALAVWRAPYILAIGISPQFTALVTRLAVAGRTRMLVRIRRLTVAGVVVGGAFGALAGFTVLLPLLRFAFGAGIDMAGPSLAALGAGTAVAFGNLGLLLMLLAFGRSRAATLAWTAALAVAAGWVGLSGTAPPDRVVLAFLLAQVTAFVLLVLLCRIPDRSPGTAPPARTRQAGP